MPINVSEAYGNHSIPNYIKLLTSSDLSNEERVKVMKGLCDTLNHPTQRQLVIGTNILERCIELLSSAKEDDQGYYGLRILTALMKDSQFRERLNQNTMLTIINRLLTSKSSRYVNQVLEIYKTLSYYPNGVTILIQHNYITITLIEIASLAETSSEQMEKAFEILRNTTNSVEGTRTAVDNDIITPLTNVLSNPMRYSNHTLISGICISSNLVILEYGELTILSKDIVRFSLNLLTSILSNIYPSATSNDSKELDDLLDKLLVLLHTLGVSKSGKYQIIKNSGVEILIQCLTKEKIKNKSIATLTSLADAPEGLKNGIILLLTQPKILAEAYGERAINVLNQLLKEERDQNQKEYILECIEEICRHTDGVQAVFQSLYMIDNIVALLNDEDEESLVKQHAIKCLYTFAHESKESANKVRRKLQQNSINEDIINYILSTSIT